ncbi:hypothetical protein DYBT9275_00503 [Dyadobacter sp. CECT 9275]|uniref:DUF1772 domain-containing protein n=1 Tax=Dyadobacter helix TaxID=2822344 RepID=A0A916J9K5_9BACT|nr:DUF1772 domain-containing protein [Dyadobacter sp. CECT 9275]CAG4990321.1 hypothetical protein DYBT9275_00503 [Dyadobacter sp. CECT 9275]
MRQADLFPYLKLVCVFIYFALASQGAFYIFLGFSKAMLNVSADTFVEIRRATDSVIGPKLKFGYLAGLALLLAWMFVSFRVQGSKSHYYAAAAFLLLAADMLLAIKLSMPINDLINDTTLKPQNLLTELQQKWLAYIVIRGALCILGLVILLFSELIHPFRPAGF